MSKPESNGNEPAAVATQTQPAQKPKTQQPTLPPYNVVLMDDDDHTYEYVIQMLRRVFGHPEQRGFQLAKVVDKQGRAIVLTTHKELAELKRDQVLSFGADPRIAASRGSMTAVIEPAEGA
jgi:ATP-dependent Clp protease adaptor protein ClpS